MVPRQRNLPAYVLAVVCALACPQLTGRAYAWNDHGHMQVAALAYARLSPKTKQRVGELLRLNPSYDHWTAGVPADEVQQAAFLWAATWADEIKSDPSYRDLGPDKEQGAAGYGDHLRHKHWHYVNQPLAGEGAAPAPNVATQIETLRQVLTDRAADDAYKSYALSWLLHLVGDVHQPLHCVTRSDPEHPHGDNGGNLVKIHGQRAPSPCRDPRFCHKPPSDSLHIFWDTLTGSSCCVSDALVASRALPAAPAAAAADLDVNTWVREGVALARDRVYTEPIAQGVGPFEMNDAYTRAAIALARERIALAGARLAGLLNAAFGTERALKAK